MQGQGAYYKSDKADDYATYGLICGVIGLVFMGIVLGPIAIYFGNKARELDDSKGMAGIILGAIDTILGIVMILFIIFLVSSFV